MDFLRNALFEMSAGLFLYVTKLNIFEGTIFEVKHIPYFYIKPTNYQVPFLEKSHHQ